MITEKPQYYIGCSGWCYPHWKGLFYPKNLPQANWLDFYAQHFNTVEVNNTFYRLPSKDVVEKWYRQVPGNFKFTLKGSRYVTHVKKLRDVLEPLQRFYEIASVLKEKTGCILWQLPPNLTHNVSRLRSFCQLLSQDFNNVIEFRHNFWYSEVTYELLKENRVGFCVVSSPEFKEEIINTSEVTYIRFHGKSTWYAYRYTRADLQEWSNRINQFSSNTVYAYFNNDYEAYAVDNSRQLDALLVNKSIIHTSEHQL